MLRNSGLIALVALVLAGCEDPEGGIFGDPVAPIEVTRPDGGEILVQGDTEAITWTAVGVTAENVNIDYSTDGVDWTNVTTAPASAGSYDWTVPGDDSKLCRVRVLEARAGGVWDESDADFRIAPAVYIEVTSPDGGEVWVVGGTETITWIASAGVAANVDIHYSTDDGATYPHPANLITTVATTDGSYTWSGVLGPASPDCRVRVQEAGGGVEDESDDVFEIRTP